MSTTTWTHHRARVANAVLRGDEAAANLARRDMRAARLELAITAAIDAAPPLTEDQRRTLAGLLLPSARQQDPRERASVQQRGPSCSHGYTTHVNRAGVTMHPNGKPCADKAPR